MLGVLKVCRRRGIDERPLLEGLALTDGLSDPRGRHSWDELTVSLARLQDATGGPSGVEEVCAETVETSPWMKLLGKLILDPQDLYYFGLERISRSLYSDVLGVALHVRANGVLETQTRIREPNRPSLAFMYATVGSMRVYPRLIGAECGWVDADLEERLGVVRIHLPPARSLIARGRRLFWDPAQLAGVAPETLQSAMEVGLDPSIPSAPAHRIGQRLAAQRTMAGLAGELEAVMSEYFLCRTIRLSVRGDDGKMQRVGEAKAEGRQTRCVQRSLVCSGEEVGRLEVDFESLEDSPLFEALLPWVAMAVESCRRVSTLERASAHGPAEVDQARLEKLAQAWSLTAREREVLGTLVRGLANKEIAVALNTSVKTCEAHVTKLLRKADADSRAELIARFWAGR